MNLMWIQNINNKYISRKLVRPRNRNEALMAVRIGEVTATNNT